MTLSRSQSRISVEEEELTVKQGIVAILESDGGERRRQARAAASIRRTLSADMSSKKWLEQNGMKKVVSSDELAKLPISADSSSSSEGEEEQEKFRRWSSTQQPATPLTDAWSSIMMSQKRNGDSPLPPPYVHPLVKRSSSGLSEKSLEICTESLGSETGSDCFSGYCSTDEGKESLEEEINQFGKLSCGAAKYKKSSAAPPRPSPPPIHSISASIHMNSHRENGRLVVEAVSVPQRNFFQAHRRDGRLVLSLMRTPLADETDDGVAEFENNNEEILEEEEGCTAAADGGYAEEEEAAEVESQNSSVTVTKSMAIGNRNPKASEDAVAVEAEEFVTPQSLPPLPRGSLLTRSPATSATTAASFNASEYFLRNMTAGGGGYMSSNLINKRRDNGLNGGVKGEQNKVEYFGPYFRGCKEARTRKSLLIWESFNCIAT